MSSKELLQRLEWWIEKETYNPGIFDSDPEFRPARLHNRDL